MNEQDLRTILARNPGVTASPYDTPRRVVQDTELERDPAATLDKVASREEKSVGRVTVSIRGCRTRLLDPDNFAGSTKDLIDGLREYLLILDDSPDHIVLVTDQVRVKTRKEERTEIVITYPND